MGVKVGPALSDDIEDTNPFGADAAKLRKLYKYNDPYDILGLRHDTKSLYYWFNRAIMVSRIHPKTNHYFRSTYSLQFEMWRHVKNQFWFIIHPYSVFNFFWKIFITFVLGVSIFHITLYNTFYRGKCSVIAIIMYSVISLFMGLDILITFITAFRTRYKHRTVFNQGFIFVRYLTGSFLLDFITAIPYDIFYPPFPYVDESEDDDDEDWHFIWIDITSILMQLRILHSFRFVREYIRIIEMFTKKEIALRIHRLVIISIIMVHCFACYIYEFNDRFPSESFPKQITESGPMINYVYSVYVTVTFFYGLDMSLLIHESMELKLFTISLFLVSIGVRIYTIYSILFILDINNMASKVYGENVNQVKRFMAIKQIPTVIQKRLLTSYQHKYRENYFDEESIMKMLSESLQEEIKMHRGRQLMAKLSLFEDVPNIVLSKILKHLVPEVYLPNDMIIKTGEIGTCMYFITSGTVAAVTETGREIVHLEDGDHFGEIALIQKDTRRVVNIIAIEYCEVYRLDKKYYLKYMSAYPQLLAKIEDVAQKRLEVTNILEKKATTFAGP